MSAHPSDDPSGAALPGDLLADFAALSAIGATPAGGVDRQAGTAADGAARRWLTAWLSEHGFAVSVDGIGNVFGSIEWLPGAPYLLVGSHLDSQPTAGRFDGAYGVLAAAHAARQIAAEVAADGLTPRLNLAVVNWFNEEGSRFTPSIMGSSVYCGVLDAESALAATDPAGTTVAQALTGIGFLGTATPPPAGCYAEIHIEQGHTLEDTGTDIGIVTANWAVRKYEIVVRGAQAHTGATVLADRHDALVGAARLVCRVRELADEFPAGRLLTAVGRFTVYPNSPVVVPAEVRLSVDLRSADLDVLELAHAWLTGELAGIGERSAVTVEVVSGSLRPAVRFPEQGCALAEDAVRDAGLSSRRMRTMAGHDAIPMNATVPTVLLFVPSVDGVSHHHDELTHDVDLRHGVLALTGVCRRLVEGALTRTDPAPDKQEAS